MTSHLSHLSHLSHPHQRQEPRTDQRQQPRTDQAKNLAPVSCRRALLPAIARAIRRRAIFECCKWDPQVEDVSTIADVPIVLDAGAWRGLVVTAERLAAEIAAAESELRQRPELHDLLGLPRYDSPACSPRQRQHAWLPAPRFIRFDFHHTDAGWRISEANTDVPGGLNEASGLPLTDRAALPGTTVGRRRCRCYAEARRWRLARSVRVSRWCTPPRMPTTGR